VNRVIRFALCLGALLLTSVPAAWAQSGGGSSNAAPSSTATPAISKLWVAAGGAFTTVRGDCQTCEEDYPYRHGASLVADVGRRINERMDVGAELFVVAINTSDGRIRTFHVDAVAQFRPWVSHGFFVNGGAGMAFVRNWVDAVGPEAIFSKALSVVVGAGWEFRPAERLGLQLFGTQHAGAIGDLQTATGSVPDVMGNFWTLGAAVVLR
jgi:hypothetical protein